MKKSSNAPNLIWRNEMSEKDWLTSQFGQVTMQYSQDGTVESSLPDVYRIAYIGFVLGNYLNSLRHREWKAIPIKATTNNEEKIYGALIESLLKNASLEDDIVAIYKPKEDQNPDILKPDSTYRIIRHNNPIHNHKDPRLIDFFHCAVIDLIPGSYPVIMKLPFDENHVHFLAHKKHTI